MRFVFSDMLVPLTGLWMFMAVTFSQGAEMSLAHAGPEVLEFFIGYMATRTVLTEHGQALSFVKLLSGTIAVVAVLGALDSLTGRYLVLDTVNELTGFGIGKQEQTAIYRNGFLRATGPLEHSILFGLACCVGLIMALSGCVRTRISVIIPCGLGVFLAGESAPMLAFVLGVTLLLYDRILNDVPGKWAVLFAVVVIAVLVIRALGKDPSTFIIQHFTLETQTGYYRLWVKGLVIDLLRQSPWFGFGFVEFSSHLSLPSIDNMWLAFATQYGYPGSVLLGLSILGAMSRSTSGRRSNLITAEAKLGTTLSIILFLIMLIANTVHIWGSDRILMGLLMGVRAHLGSLGHSNMDRVHT